MNIVVNVRSPQDTAEDADSSAESTPDHAKVANPQSTLSLK